MKGGHDMTDAIDKLGLTAADVRALIAKTDERHKIWMRTHKALLRALEAREGTEKKD
jgi:hypothetical protein